MEVISDFGSNPEYQLQANENEMFLECPNRFSLYFMKISDHWIKIMGSILVDDQEIYEKVKGILEDLFLGMEYNIVIDNFENGASITISSIEDAKNSQIKATSFRATGFNTRSIDLNASETKKPTENKKKGFGVGCLATKNVLFAVENKNCLKHNVALKN